MAVGAMRRRPTNRRQRLRKRPRKAGQFGRHQYRSYAPKSTVGNILQAYAGPNIRKAAGLDPYDTSKDTHVAGQGARAPGASPTPPATPGPKTPKPRADVIPAYADLVNRGQGAFTGLLGTGTSLAGTLYNAALRYGNRGSIDEVAKGLPVKITNPNYLAALIDTDPTNDFVKQILSGGPGTSDPTFKGGFEGDNLTGSSLWDIARNRLTGKRDINSEHLLSNTLFSGNRLLDLNVNEEEHNRQVADAAAEFRSALDQFNQAWAQAHGEYFGDIEGLASEGRERYFADEDTRTEGGGGEGAVPPTGGPGAGGGGGGASTPPTHGPNQPNLSDVFPAHGPTPAMVDVFGGRQTVGPSKNPKPSRTKRRGKHRKKKRNRG